MMLAKITHTLALLLLCQVTLISYIGGECDTDAKEWLTIFMMITFIAFVCCSLWLVWG
jgi:hypothetical protein